MIDIIIIQEHQTIINLKLFRVSLIKSYTCDKPNNKWSRKSLKRKKPMKFQSENSVSIKLIL